MTNGILRPHVWCALRTIGLECITVCIGEVPQRSYMRGHIMPGLAGFIPADDMLFGREEQTMSEKKSDYEAGFRYICI